MSGLPGDAYTISEFALAPHLRTVPAMLATRAQQHPNRALLRTDEVERTVAQTVDVVARAAGTLIAAGIRTGDRVALMAENRFELLDLILGCAWMGAVAVPLNTALRGPALEHQLRDSGSSLLVVDPGLAHVLDAVARPSSLKQVWVFPGPGSDGAGYDLLPAAADPAPAAPVSPGTTAAILYTSGTTGAAKGVICPHAQMYWWGINTADQLMIGPDDVLYTCLPLFHINALGTFFQALVTGATFHVGPRFSASAMMTRLADSGATVTYLLGAMISIVASRPPAAHDTEHRVTRALAPSASANQVEEWRTRFGIELVDGYGSTETNAVIGPRPGEQRPGLMGPVRPGYEARVVDAEDNELPDGVAGELVIRGHEPFSTANGYFGAGEKTVEAWRNLWFHTGDLVERTPDGWFRFRDRLKDSIRRRGENISSHDVEEALRSHPDVAQVAAYALPCELGEDEVAVAVVSNGQRLQPEALVRWCEGRLAYFAIPRFVRFVDDLPLTENGKVRKSALRDEGAEPCWDRQLAGVEVSRAR